MKLSFVEAQDFTKAVYEYFGNDTEFATFQDALLANPERGDVIPGCGGLRKTRWRDTRRRKGARGGLRIIYLHIPDASRIFLVDVYDKDETDDLTPDEKRFLASLAQTYREEARHNQKQKGR